MLDRIPPDQRAVLQMVLGRGKSFDEIGRLLSIDRAAVRERALRAFDTLGPATRVPHERRALITDYLLGQLPARVSEEVKESLADSATERAWARVVASELSPLTAKPLPKIPVGRADAPADGRVSAREKPVGKRSRPVSDDGASATRLRSEVAPEEDAPRSSRLGGAILLAAVAIAAIAAILIFVVFGVGDGPSHKSEASAARTGGLTTSSTSSSRPLAQINLSSPSKKSKAVGIAEVLKVGSTNGVVIVAQGLAPNSKHDAYAVWLYNSSSSFDRLGYVQQGVASNGKLQTAGRLPANASKFKQIVVTLQTGPANKPGKIVLQGSIPASGGL